MARSPGRPPVDAGPHRRLAAGVPVAGGSARQPRADVRPGSRPIGSGCSSGSSSPCSSSCWPCGRCASRAVETRCRLVARRSPGPRHRCCLARRAWRGGRAGIALAALAVIAFRLQRSVLAQLAGGLAFAAVLLVAWRPFPGSDALDLAAGPQVLVLAALAVVVLGLAAELGSRGQRRSPPTTEPVVEVAGSDVPPPAS